MFSRTLRPLSRCLAGSAARQPIVIRPLHQTAQTAWPRKDSQDKDSINREATEYSKSGTDDSTAAQEEASFDPNITSPDAEQAKAGEGMGVSNQNRPEVSQPNPLDVSPANPEVSKTRPDDEGGPEHAPGERERSRTSGGGSGKKNG
ncbi:MAG: Protein kinase C-like 1 [Watsoniomyces obsoletus]|nr:MAG: Protein kinase C-like 1 [Watsoniomyces obsoletus]